MCGRINLAWSCPQSLSHSGSIKGLVYARLPTKSSTYARGDHKIHKINLLGVHLRKTTEVAVVKYWHGHVAEDDAEWQQEEE